MVARTARLQADALAQMEEQLKLKAATLDALREQTEQRVRDGIAAARQEMLEARRAEDDSVRLRENTLRDELAMVRQQQQIHARLVEDLADTRSKLDAAQGELATRCEELGAANGECRDLRERLERVRDYDAVLHQATLMRSDLAALREERDDVKARVEHLEAVEQEQRITIAALRWAEWCV